MSEWKEYKISDIADVIGGGTPKTAIDEYWNGDIPWLSVVDFNTGKKYVSNTEKSITPLGLEKSSTKLLTQNDIIISARGTVGALAMLDKPMTFNQSCYGMRAKENTTSDYLFYLLKNTVRHLQQASYGAVFDTITRNTFDETYISLPPLKEQKAIAEVLSSLDDKIDLLHRQNKTLEELAQTLFRQWFIEEAKDEWEEVPLKDICTIINGFAFKSGDYKDSGRMIIRTMNFENGFIDTSNVVYIDLEEEHKYSKQQLQKNDFLLVMVGASLGEFSIVTSDILPALQNQNMWNFRSLGNISQHYLNFALRQIIENNMGSASGSAREFFQKGQFYKFLITVPDNTKMTTFENYAEDFYSKIEKNREQIKSLENMRDTLLPKLMSGEVRVKDI